MRRTLICLSAAIALLCVKPPALAGTAEQRTAGDVGRIVLTAAAAGAAWAHKDPEGGKQLFLSLAATIAATEGLKLVVKERRPDGTDDDAFPSGHASVAFAGAAFLQRRYGWTWGAPAYLLASFVGVTRIQADEHRLHDVLAGAAIGIAANVAFTTPHRTIAVAPTAGKDFIGIAVRAAF